jgi:hypothetical protein
VAAGGSCRVGGRLRLLAATIAVHFLAEQYLCPARDLVMGICNNASLGLAL